jgi:DNA-directed RNA polymerase sigma subunit (sigma70/sigma32)
MAAVPEDATEKINRVVLAYRQEFVETGRRPSNEELAQKLDFPLEEVRRVMDLFTLRIP